MSDTLQRNPSLRLTSTFEVFDSEKKTRRHFDYALCRYPAIKESLQSLCEEETETASFSSLAESLQQELLQHKILQWKRNKEGDEQLEFNPNAQLKLTVSARYNDAPASRKAFPLRKFTDAAKWLMTNPSQQNTEADAIAVETLKEKSRALLEEVGALVTESPPPAAEYPSTDEQHIPWQEQIAGAEEVIIQAAGTAAPDKVLTMLGRHLPELPNETIVWLRDAGTRLPYATRIPEESLEKIEISGKQRATLESVIRQKSLWQQNLSAAKINFKRQRYAQLGEIINPAFQVQLQHHMRRLLENCYFGPLGDGQVTRRMALHNEAVSASLHHRLAKLVSLIVGEKVRASYAYLGCYLSGSVLERHLDRPQCQYNLSIVFDMCDEQEQAVEPWPIYLQIKNKPVAIKLNIGDGLLYQGTKIEHWREELPENQRAIVCFYHFVSESFDGSLS